MSYSTLHGEAARVFEEIYKKALDTYKGDKQKAAATAWSGLKGAGYRKNDAGEWSKSKAGFAELSMTIVKAAYEKKGNIMRFRAVASDTDPDLYAEAMSPELFKDFVGRIENDTPIPEAFKSAVCEDTWCGGLPYPSISHYKAGPNGANVPGQIDSVYVDGNRLKSTGSLHDTELGRRVFKSLCDDLYTEKSADHLPVRISIGFLDLQHSHRGTGMNYTFERKNLTDQCPMCIQGVGGKVYERGILVHEAFTRVPVNPRTEAEVERSMSDAIVTKKDDAASIVGEDMANVLVDKSQADVLVVKGDTVSSIPTNKDQQKFTVDPDPNSAKHDMVNAEQYRGCYDSNTGLWDQECIDQELMGHFSNVRQEMYKNIPDNTTHDMGVNDVPAGYYPKKAQRDGDHTASHYLVVGDASKPDTWHLPVKDPSGKINTRLLGAAHAALTSNYRGHSYGGPDKGKALAKLHSLYKSAGLKCNCSDDSSKEKSAMETVDKGPKSAPVPGSPKKVDIFNDDDLFPEPPSTEEIVHPTGAGAMQAPAGTVTNVKAAYAGKEDDAEEEAEDKMKKAKPKMEKALVIAARSLIQEVVNQKAQGVYGDMALQAIQPHMNAFGEAVRRSVTYSGNDAMYQAIAALTQEVSVLRAQLAGQNVIPQTAQVQRSGVPTSRAITFNPATMAVMQQQSQAQGELGGLTTDKKPFSQIATLARKSVGL